MDISHVPFDVAFEVIHADVACSMTFHVTIRFCDGIKFLLTHFAPQMSFDVSLEGLG